MVKTGRLQRRSTTNSSKIFDVIITILMFLIAFLFLLPLLHVLACSFSSGEAIVAGEVGLFPSEFNIEGYIKVFQEENLLKGFGNSIFYTFLGTIIQVSLQML